MAADFTQTNTVIDFSGSAEDLEIIPFSLSFEVSNVMDFNSGGGGGSSRPSSGFLYPRGTG